MSRIDQLGGSVNPVLTKFAVGYNEPQFIAERICPVIPSLTETGTIITKGKDGFLIFETRREIGNPIPKAVPPDFSSDTYQLAEEAIERDIDERELNAAQDYGTAEVLALKEDYAAKCKSNVLMKMEQSVASYVFSATYYASGNKVTLTGGDQFSDYVNSDPVNVVKDGKIAARADMGIEPNIGVIGYAPWLVLREHPQLIEKFKYTQKGILTPDLVAMVFGLDELIVGTNVYSTDAGVFTDLWGDFFALLYRPPAEQLRRGGTPHTVIIRHKRYPLVREYPKEKVLFPIAYHDMFTVKNISTSYGYLISDMVAA